MKNHPYGLGSLTEQPQYIPSNTRIARHAARFYRPFIFIITATLVAQTTFKLRDGPFLMHVILVGSIIAYTLVFVLRMRMKKNTEHHYYKPQIQFVRGQASLIGVTALIFLLAYYGYYSNILWLLYVLATLIISEHNSTPVVLLTLIEVSVIYVFVTYLGWGFHTENWLKPLAFWQANDSLGEHILGIWLITLVFHYLVRNIQGRDRAIKHHEKWRNQITEKWALTDAPDAKRQNLLAVIEEITGGQATLWQPRQKDGMLLNADKKQVSAQFIKAIEYKQPILWFRNAKQRKGQISDCLILNGDPPREEAFIQAAFPIYNQNDPHELLGVLDIVCMQENVDEHKITIACNEIQQLSNDIRLLLINMLQYEHSQLLLTLSLRLHHRANILALCQQVVDDIVNELGFDFATISLVDSNEDLIRGKAECEANWIQNSIHPLSRNTSRHEDIQCKTIRQGTVHINKGKFEPGLDGKIWHQYQHWQYTRVWLPIPDPAITSRYPAVGTIEAGFNRQNRETIPPNLIHLLEQYAFHIGLALADAEAHRRTQELAEQLTTLQSLSHKMQQAAVYFSLQDMIQLIGASAEKLLDADIVMLYSLEEKSQHVELEYVTEQSLQGQGKLQVSLGSEILNHLYTSKAAYFSQDARHDSLLVNMHDGQLNRRQRTFTQRQNIKSFAGLPLLNKRQNVLGFLCINYRKRREFHQEFEQIIKLFAAQVAVALEETGNQSLTRRIAIAQERNHIKSELHHTLSQNLFGLAQYTNTVYRYAQNGDMPQMMPNLIKLKDTADKSRETLRDMLTALTHTPDGPVNFVKEVKDYICRMRLLYPHVTIHFSHTNDEEVPSQIQFFLSRIVHEGINNALRHAQCQAIYIIYTLEETGSIALLIEDDGVGFNMNKAHQNGHFGLESMEYCAQQINSFLKIQSEEEGGTQIKVTVPPLTIGVIA